MNQQIKAKDIQPGMIVKIYDGTEQVPVAKAATDKWGAVTITDLIHQPYGLSAEENVTIAGYFNP